MVRPSSVVLLVLTVSPGCGAVPVRPQPGAPPASHSDAARADQYHEMATPAAAPESGADRGIRRDLNLALAADPHLKEREINFAVTNGDVSVTGVVNNEDERKKINDLAMGISGVKSVANAVRIAE